MNPHFPRPETTYRPGGVHVLVTTAGLLALDGPGATAEVVQALWSGAQEGLGLPELVDMVRTSLPGQDPVLVALAAGPIGPTQVLMDSRVVLTRGHLGPLVPSMNGQWQALDLTQTTELDLDLEATQGGRRAPATPILLPVEHGVVLASRVHLDLHSEPQPVLPPPTVAEEPAALAEGSATDPSMTDAGATLGPDALERLDDALEEDEPAIVSEFAHHFDENTVAADLARAAINAADIDDDGVIQGVPALPTPTQGTSSAKPPAPPSPPPLSGCPGPGPRTPSASSPAATGAPSPLGAALPLPSQAPDSPSSVPTLAGSAPTPRPPAPVPGLPADSSQVSASHPGPLPPTPPTAPAPWAPVWGAGSSAPTGAPAPVPTDSHGQPAPSAHGPWSASPPAVAPTQRPPAPSTDAGTSAQGQGGPLSMPEAAPASAGAGSWQHDGATLTSAQLRALRGDDPARTQAALALQPQQEEGVLARVCPAGHASSAAATHCRVCHATLTAQPERVQPPVLANLRVNGGAEVPLEHAVVIGRSPTATPQPGREVPRLLVITDPTKSVSKNHCRVYVEGWTVLVEDLGSVNGTYLLRPGAAARRLSSHSPQVMQIGDVLSLAEEINVTLEARDE